MTGPAAATAATYTWNASQSGSGPSDGSGTWNTTTTNWWNGSSNIAWPNLSGASADIAAFGTGSGTGGTVTLSTASTLNVAGLQFNATSSSFFTLSSGTVAIADSGTIALADNSRSPVITSVVTGSNITVAKLGATTSANVSLNGNNRLTGTTTISGTLSTATFGLSVTAGHTNAFGTSAIVVESGAMFLPNVSGTFANNLFISGSGIGGTRGAIRQEVGGAVTLSGSITMTGDASINSYGGNRVLTLSGPIAESGATPRSLTLFTQTPGTDQNTLILTAASTYTGSTSITGVTVRLSGGNDRLPAATRVAIGGSGNGRLVLGGNSQTLAGLSMVAGGTGFVVGGTTTTSALVLNIASGTSTFAGTIGGTATNDNNLSLTKRGAGTFSLTGTNTLTGATSVEAGTLALGSANPLPNSTVALSSGATLRMDASATVNFLGPGNVQLGGNVLTTGTDNISRTYDGVISGTAGSGFAKIGTGTTTLTGANTLTGTLTAGQGVLTIGSVGTTATANPLGQGTVGLGSGTFVGTLRYTGASGTANHSLRLTGSAGGGVIEANGTGPLTLTGAVTAANGNKTLTLAGSNAGDNSIGAINDAPSLGGMTSLVKTGVGRWLLTGTGNYTGSTTIEQGDLVLVANAISSSGALGNTAGITIGSAAGSGTAALLLRQGVTVNSRNFTIPGGSQATVIGAVDGSGTATFGFTGSPLITLGRNTALQAATGGTLVFDNEWAQASGTSVNVVIGGIGNEGTVRLGQPLAVTGTVRIDGGLLSLAPASNPSFSGSLAAASAVVVGPAGSANTILSVRDLTSGTYAFGPAQSLSGIGTIRLDADTPVSVAGFFSPGNSPGIFTFEGDGSGGATTLSGTTFMEITGTTVGTAYDQVRFTNGATLNYGSGSSSGSLLLHLTGTYADNTQFQLFDFASTASGSFTTISGSGSYGLLSFVRGTGGVWTSGSTSQPNQTFTFTESTGTLVVVPEPATLALAAVGIGLAGWATFCRRK